MFWPTVGWVLKASLVAVPALITTLPDRAVVSPPLVAWSV